MVSVIIPAFNEESRVVSVVRAAMSSGLADEIIVVDDGSTDGTASAARAAGARVVRLSSNQGKGAAMVAGARSCSGSILVFLDADLVGFRPDHLKQLIVPVRTGRCTMSLGVLKGGGFWSSNAQAMFPFFTGQRAMTRAFFESVPHLDRERMGAEVALNAYAKQVGAKVLRVYLQGVGNTHKESKLGVVRGTAARAKMYKEMAHAVVRARRHTSFTSWR